MNAKVVFLFAVLGLLFILSGCAQQGNTTANPPLEVDDTIPTDDSTKGTMTDDSAPSTGVTATLAQLATASPPGGYKADYAVVTGSASGSVNSAITMYGKYPQFRTDSTIATGAMTIESRTFYSVGGEEMTICSNFGGKWNCQSQPQTSDSMQAGTYASDPDLTFEPDGSKTVVGETGTCFKGHRISDPDQVFKLCYTSDGILLYTHFTSGEGAASDMTVTSISRGIDDSVFVEPA